MWYQAATEDSNILTMRCSAQVSVPCYGPPVHMMTPGLWSGSPECHHAQQTPWGSATTTGCTRSWVLQLNPHIQTPSSSGCCLKIIRNMKNYTCCLTKVVWHHEEHSNSWNILVESFLLYRGCWPGVPDGEQISVTNLAWLMASDPSERISTLAVLKKVIKEAASHHAVIIFEQYLPYVGRVDDKSIQILTN